MKHTIQIKCPACHETIEIDSVSGKVEKHFKEGVVKKAGGNFFKESLEALKEEEATRSERFDRLKQEKDSRMKKLKERFKKEKEKVKQSADDIKPLRPFDLD